MKKIITYFILGTYLVLEDNKPSFIIRSADCGWVAYDTIDCDKTTDENNWAVCFKTKKELLNYACQYTEGKKLTCKRIKRTYTI